jgi:hypothetical protein
MTNIPLHHSPEYLLTINAIYQCMLDGLDGHGAQELDWLLDPQPQAALQLLLDQDDDLALAATQRAIAKIKFIISAGQGHKFRLVMHWRKDADALREMMR